MYPGCIVLSITSVLLSYGIRVTRRSLPDTHHIVASHSIKRKHARSKHHTQAAQMSFRFDRRTSEKVEGTMLMWTSANNLESKYPANPCKVDACQKKTPHHITSYHITPHHITSHHITSHHITLHRGHESSSAPREQTKPVNRIYSTSTSTRTSTSTTSTSTSTSTSSTMSSTLITPALPQRALVSHRGTGAQLCDRFPQREGCHCRTAHCSRCFWKCLVESFPEICNYGTLSVLEKMSADKRYWYNSTPVRNQSAVRLKKVMKKSLR